MLNYEYLYSIRDKIPKIVKNIFPKFIKRKINKIFFKYYFVPTKFYDLPKLNYLDEQTIEYQKNLITKFNLNNKQTSFMTYPNLIELLFTKFDTKDKFNFLDVGGEKIDFYLSLKKNFENVKYFVFNQDSMIKPFFELKNDYKFDDLYIIEKIENIFEKNYEFVNFGSCIQYFNNYEYLLNGLTKKSKYIFFSGTHLYDSPEKKFQKNIIVKQLNFSPNYYYLFFFNRKYFFKKFDEENFELVFERKNLTDNVNYDNFKNYLQNISYSDFLFIKK